VNTFRILIVLLVLLVARHETHAESLPLVLAPVYKTLGITSETPVLQIGLKKSSSLFEAKANCQNGFNQWQSNPGRLLFIACDYKQTFSVAGYAVHRQSLVIPAKPSLFEKAMISGSELKDSGGFYLVMEIDTLGPFKTKAEQTEAATKAAIDAYSRPYNLHAIESNSDEAGYWVFYSKSLYPVDSVNNAIVAYRKAFAKFVPISRD
jgi:hypothetical protein